MANQSGNDELNLENNDRENQPRKGELSNRNEEAGRLIDVTHMNTKEENSDHAKQDFEYQPGIPTGSEQSNPLDTTNPSLSLPPPSPENRF